jgi:hypothetical protein
MSLLYVYNENRSPSCPPTMTPDCLPPTSLSHFPIISTPTPYAYNKNRCTSRPPTKTLDCWPSASVSCFLAILKHTNVSRVQPKQVHITPSYRDTGLSATYTFEPLSNLVYTRDQQITTCKGIVMGRLRSQQRQREVHVMNFCIEKLGAGCV